MWDTAAVIDWLGSLGIGRNLAVNLPLFKGPYLPDEPDRLGLVTTIPGPGLQAEGVIDVGGFQLLIRGRQDPKSRDSTAERDALAADRLILRAPLPAEVAPGVRLLPVNRSGGRPTPLPQEDGDRIAFVCTYLTAVLED